MMKLNRAGRAEAGASATSSGVIANKTVYGYRHKQNYPIGGEGKFLPSKCNSKVVRCGQFDMKKRRKAVCNGCSHLVEKPTPLFCIVASDRAASQSLDLRWNQGAYPYTRTLEYQIMGGGVGVE